jgi:hypothetical protein
MGRHGSYINTLECTTATGRFLPPGVDRLLLEAVKKIFPRYIINQFLDRIRRDEPHIRYEAYRLRGSDSFIHLIAFPDVQFKQTHWNAPHTEQPVYTDLDKIESMLGGEYE